VSSNNNFSIINRFRSIIHLASISNSNLVRFPSISFTHPVPIRI
jgi:hypothetical protein